MVLVYCTISEISIFFDSGYLVIHCGSLELPGSVVTCFSHDPQVQSLKVKVRWKIFLIMNNHIRKSNNLLMRNITFVLVTYLGSEMVICLALRCLLSKSFKSHHSSCYWQCSSGHHFNHTVFFCVCVTISFTGCAYVPVFEQQGF